MYADLAARVMARCDQLGMLSEERGRLTRPSYTPALRQAHVVVGGWLRAAGMDVSEDAAGNLSGIYPGTGTPARSLVIGSHLDTVRDAGRYDGVLGVLIGIAAVEVLQAQARRLPCAVEVVAFADEEGLRFGTSYLGSLAFTGGFDPALLALRDAHGIKLAEAISTFGGVPAALGSAARSPQQLLAYLEVHIEQGPVLEAHGLPLGIVSSIAGASRLSLSLTGAAGHAGTVPMDLRHDALCAAAEIVLAAESLARVTPGLVATVGQLTVRPGASNVIPGAVDLSLDLRHQDDQIRLEALATLRSRSRAAAAVRGVALSWNELQSSAAVPMAPALRERLAGAVAATGVTPLELPSGAGHDAAVLARVTDTAMLFVRSAGGVSHNPAETVAADDVARAIAAVGWFLEELATSEAPGKTRRPPPAGTPVDRREDASERLQDDDAL